MLKSAGYPVTSAHPHHLPAPSGSGLESSDAAYIYPRAQIHAGTDYKVR